MRNAFLIDNNHDFRMQSNEITLRHIEFPAIRQTKAEGMKPVFQPVCELLEHGLNMVCRLLLSKGPHLPASFRAVPGVAFVSPNLGSFRNSIASLMAAFSSGSSSCWPAMVNAGMASRLPN